MKMIYQNPELELIALLSADVITGSLDDELVSEEDTTPDNFGKDYSVGA